MSESGQNRRLDPSFWLSLFMVIVILIGVVTAFKWRWDTRLFPWAIGIPALALAIWQLFIDLRGGRFRSPPAVKKPSRGPVDIPVDAAIPAEVRSRRTLRAMGWIAGFALGIWLLGFLIAIPIFVFLYLIYEARCGGTAALLLTGCTELFIWGIFDQLMHLAWPRAALFIFFR